MRPRGWFHFKKVSQTSTKCFALNMFRVGLCSFSPLSKGSNHILSDTLKHPEMAAKIGVEILCKFLPAPFFSYITFCTVPMELSRGGNHADHSQWFYYTLEAFCLAVLWDCVFRTDKRWRFRSDWFKKHLFNVFWMKLSYLWYIWLWNYIPNFTPKRILNQVFFNWVLATTKSTVSL